MTNAAGRREDALDETLEETVQQGPLCSPLGRWEHANTESDTSYSPDLLGLGPEISRPARWSISPRAAADTGLDRAQVRREAIEPFWKV
jgi:hypothetical protein